MAKGQGPLEQIKIKPLVELQAFGHDISFTNSSLMLAFAVLAIILFFTFGTKNISLVPGRFQLMVESLYEFIANMVKDNVGTQGKKYFPFVLSIFLLVLGANLIGMLPYAFTSTSHIVLTFALAIFAFVIVNIIGFAKHGFKFFKLFVPDGVPLLMIPIISSIEVISYLMRPFTLAVRLAAAMTAGHIVMKIFAGFIISLASLSWGGFEYIMSVLPMIFAIGLVGLELLVAGLQAFIFSILICIYLNDAVNMH